ncbi:serine hydrolase domain-containing protein [Crossiella cryophila]|uniref:CubicO group peptidase (Beta-lactamase class C family) n=1 Tax=Crossiella cryophila TaxID=43355 RepID=A0A7W7CCL4_9PSEU|nr:serine hydrolase domain-containing protein [Crossiella cryophila]MBB4678644.1 CubicO group peptidase (beta-lactamase class C family) [Crossiella cryophila]
MNSDSAGAIDRRRLLGWGGLAAGVVAGAPLAGAGLGHAAPEESSRQDRLPPDTLPGGAYDRFVAKLAAEDKFCGTVLLSYRGRTVLSRSYGMADKEKGIRNHDGVAVNLGSAVQPFAAVAILQLAQQGRVRLWEPVGTHLKGFATGILEQVQVHHLLSGTSGMVHPPHDLQRVFHRKEEVHEYWERWARQGKLEFAPGSDSDRTEGSLVVAAQIVEAVTGLTYWDYVHEHIFRRAGMTGSGFFTRTQWLTEPHIAHSYMRQADGSRVDAVRNLDKGGLSPFEPGKNNARAFIDHAGNGGFATAADLARFAQGLRDGTVLQKAYADLLTQAKLPIGRGKFGGPPPDFPAFTNYTMPMSIHKGQWVTGRGGTNPGTSVNYNLYLDSGWVGVVLSNYDDIPLGEILELEQNVIMGPP